MSFSSLWEIKWLQTKCHWVQTQQYLRFTHRSSLTVGMTSLMMIKLCEIMVLTSLQLTKERRLKCLQAVIPGARHGQIQCWLIIITQLCLNGLNIQVRGLLLFMSVWTRFNNTCHTGTVLVKIQQGAICKQFAVRSGILYNRQISVQHNSMNTVMHWNLLLK